MKLTSFSVTNYRSITKAHKIPIGDLTVLVGKNNEGKSNFLKALNIAMTTLSKQALRTTGLFDKRINLFIERKDPLKYDWNRDFPISLQKRKGVNESIFRLEFELDSNEISDFKKQIRSSINSILPIEIKFGKTNQPSITIPKKGHGSTTLSKKTADISDYIAERIDFNYIPAIRTDEEALSVVQEMLSKELSELESDIEYQNALNKISELQQPILNKVGESIQNSLKLFLPNIKSVSVKIPSSSRRMALRNQCEIEIDDGTKTLLDFKGDGVKSLSALGLLKDKKIVLGTSLIAIEEPEAHLHPSAMHSLRDVISNLTNNNQVVITTHCPIFVDREKVSRNILINSQKAIQAKDISEIREILGVCPSDNLINASHVLLVEGETDSTIITSILSKRFPIISKAIRTGQLVIYNFRGTRNILHGVNYMVNNLCNVHVFLDADTSGKEASKKIIKEGLVNVSNITMTNCLGLRESEIEDCIDSNCYRSMLNEKYGINIDRPEFKAKEKWSKRMEALFHKQGKPWDSDIEKELKFVVAECVKLSTDEALCEYKGTSLIELGHLIESKLSKG